MWRFICLLLLNLTLIPFSYSDENIMRWTAQIENAATGKKMFISASILLGIEEPSPALIDFTYTSAEGADAQLISAKNILIFYYDKVSGKFQILFKEHGYYGFFDREKKNEIHSDYKDFGLYLPNSLTFVPSSNSRPAVIILDPVFSNQRGPMTIKPQVEHNIEVKNFVPSYTGSYDSVFVPNFDYPYDRSAYFKTKGLKLPKLNLSPKSQELAVPKNISKPRITRWTSNFDNSSTMQPGHITISILDAETNPVLMEFNYSMGTGLGKRNIFLHDIELFESTSGWFTIRFKKKNYLNMTGGLHSYFDDFKEYLPESLTFTLNPNQTTASRNINLKPSDLIKDESIRFLPKKVEQIEINDFKESFPGSTGFVFEPSATLPILSEAYFYSKGAQFYFDSKGIRSLKMNESPAAAAESSPPVIASAAKNIKRMRAKVGKDKLGEISVAIGNLGKKAVLADISYNVDGLDLEANDIEKLEKLDSYFRVTYRKDKNPANPQIVLTFSDDDPQLLVQKNTGHGLVSYFTNWEVEEEKRITRWRTTVRNNLGVVVGSIYLSVLDAKTNPVLIEAYYDVNGVNRAVSNIDKFEVVPDKPGHFRIKFRLPRAMFYDVDGKVAHPSDKLSVPQSLSFNLNDDEGKSALDLEMISDLDSSDKNITPLVAYREQISTDNFTSAPGSNDWHYRVIRPGDTGYMTYDDYFSFYIRGVSFPKLDSSIVSANKVTAPKADEEKRITRWGAPINNEKGKYLGEIYLSVFDVETNPVLMDVAYFNDGVSRNLRQVDKFERIYGSPGKFKITFHVHKSYYTSQDPNKLIVKKDNNPVPRSVIFDINDKDPIIELEPISDLDDPNKNIKLLKASLAKYTLEESSKFGFNKPDEVLVLSTTQLLPAAQFFSAKGIYFPGINEPEEEKRITRWTAIIPGHNGIDRGRIELSIFDAETNPALIEVFYTYNGVKKNFFGVEKFELVAGAPGKFKINFRIPGMYYRHTHAEGTVLDLANPDIHFVPTSISFDINEKDPIINVEVAADIVSANKNVNAFKAQRKKIAPKDFKKLNEDWAYRVLEPSTLHKLSYSTYFGPKGIYFPGINEPEKEKRITRWTAIIQTPDGRKDGTIELSVFDAETNPALIEISYYNNGIVRQFWRVEKFELVAGSPGKFKVTFEVPIEYYLFSNKKKLIKDESVLYVPKSATFDINDKDPIIELEMISDLDSPNKNIKSLKAQREKIASEDFKKSNDDGAYKVLEPSTIHPLPYSTYFGAKGIHFPHFKSSSSGNSSSVSYQHSSSQRVSSVDDLELGELLKDKKAEIWQLLQSKDKPTITEFLKVIGVKPKKGDTNPFKEYTRNYSLRSELERNLPKVIAQFEKAFPGAIWYGLGRDIYLFGDAMDAYYIHMGQSDRVKRLHASQPSFDEDNVEEVVDFLTTNGFDFKGINKDSTPRIIFDVTTYSKKNKGDGKFDRFSQSAQLMRAAYHEWQRLGRDPRELLSKVNFVSVSEGPHNFMIEPFSNIERFFKETKFDPPAPQRIFRVDGPKSLQYATSWHGIYERFVRTKDNRIETPFNPFTYNSDKLAMLAELWDVAAVVMNDNFAKSTAEQIKKFTDPKEVEAAVKAQYGENHGKPEVKTHDKKLDKDKNKDKKAKGKDNNKGKKAKRNKKDPIDCDEALWAGLPDDLIDGG